MFILSSTSIIFLSNFVLSMGFLEKALSTQLESKYWLSRKKYKEVLTLAQKAHDALNCRGVTRSDFKFYNNVFYLLEINTQPGMTSLSLVPEITNYKNISFDNLIEKILLDASINR